MLDRTVVQEHIREILQFMLYTSEPFYHLVQFLTEIYPPTPPTLQTPWMTLPPVVASRSSRMCSRSLHEFMNTLSKPILSAKQSEPEQVRVQP
ncbi:MAG: hypothetical protein MZV70_30410 [Desulfobacterales bacterium]|nr:hypothetical protein [Desulfobacterales bacterium]